MRISAVIVSHEQPEEVGRCLAALGTQVDELVVVANTSRSAGVVPANVRVLENVRPQGYSANANAGVRETTGEAVLVVNPDALVRPGAVRHLTAFMELHPRCGIVGPQLVYPDGRWQPSRRTFPTVRGTLVRRTPLRLLLNPSKRQRRHYLLDDRPMEPVQADWMLGAFLLLRRRMMDDLHGFDEGFRLYCEDIDLCYRAARAGWERWYIPAAVAEHAYPAEIDHRFLTKATLWHARGMARFVRKHPERLFAM